MLPQGLRRYRLAVPATPPATGADASPATPPPFAAAAASRRSCAATAVTGAGQVIPGVAATVTPDGAAQALPRVWVDSALNSLAAAEKIKGAYVSGMPWLTLLAPDIVEAILVDQRPELTAPKLTAPLPVGWERQRAMMHCRGALLGVESVMTPAGLPPVAWLHGASAAPPWME